MQSMTIVVFLLWSVKFVSAAPPVTDFKFTRSTLPINATNLGPNNKQPLQTFQETLTYGCRKTVSQTLNDRDFYLNSIGLIRLLSLRDQRGSETPKTVHREDAKSVGITVGGGPSGNEPMPRHRMLQLMAGMVDAVTEEYGFHPLMCDVYLGNFATGTPVGRFVSVVVPSDPEPLPQDETEIVEAQNATSFASPGGTSAIVWDDVLPRCQSIFSDSNVVSIGDFFNIITIGMVAMAKWGPGETVGVSDFRSPIYKLEVRIRGVKDKATTFLLRPMDVINTLFVLVLQQLLRVDNLGRPYNTVFTRIHRILPEKGDTQIGTLGIDQPKSLTVDDPHPEELQTF